MSFARFQDARSIYTITIFRNTIKVHLEELVFKNATYNSTSPNEILTHKSNVQIFVWYKSQNADKSNKRKQLSGETYCIHGLQESTLALIPQDGSKLTSKAEQILKLWPESLEEMCPLLSGLISKHFSLIHDILSSLPSF